MSERPHLTHSFWPLFHLTFPLHKHTLTHSQRASPHPNDYHSPQRGPSSSPICYQLSGTKQPWYSPLTSVCSRLSVLSGPGGTGRDPLYHWCHQIRRWGEPLVLVEEAWGSKVEICDSFNSWLWLKRKNEKLRDLWCSIFKNNAILFSGRKIKLDAGQLALPVSKTVYIGPEMKKTLTSISPVMCFVLISHLLFLLLVLQMCFFFFVVFPGLLLTFWFVSVFAVFVCFHCCILNFCSHSTKKPTCTFIILLLSSTRMGTVGILGRVHTCWELLTFYVFAPMAHMQTQFWALKLNFLEPTWTRKPVFFGLNHYLLGLKSECAPISPLFT